MTEHDDPPRWSKGADTPAGLSHLLSSAERDGASDAELLELQTRLSNLLDAAPAASSSSGLPLVAKLGSGALIAALGLGVVLSLQHRHPSETDPREVSHAPARTEIRSPAIVAPPTAQDPLPITPSAAPAPTTPPSAPTKPHSSGTASGAATLGTVQSEASLLEAARAALSTNPERALLLTRQHGAQFPHGALAQEREVIAISALRRLGRNSEADARAAHFDAAYPKSVHQQAVDRPTPR